MRTHSIRRDLLARLLGPLLLIMVLGGASAYGLARYFSQMVLDQWLHDSAISLANRVRWEAGRPTIDLPEGAREILEWDMFDRIYYEVVTERGERIVANAALPALPDGVRVTEHPLYYDGHVGKARVRVLALAMTAPGASPVTVKVAETLVKRDVLATQVLWISVALSLLLAAAAAGAIWYAIGSGMASMENAIRRVRGMHSAAPLTPIAVDRAMPQEVLPLVHEINDLIRDLSHAHRLNQRFIADAAHQLRTPLAALRVQFEVALREKDPARHLQAIDDAIGVLTRMGHVLHQLLTLARADEGSERGSVQRGLVDLDLIARDEVERRLDDALQASIDLGYADPGRAVRIRGSDELVREAVANLLDNALRYAGRGAHVTVGVNARPAEVYVEDDGPGIPESERANVTKRFYRMAGAPGDGCGLGLSIASEIVHRHGGELAFEARAGGDGLRARLVFPDYAVSEERQERETASVAV